MQRLFYSMIVIGLLCACNGSDTGANADLRVTPDTRTGPGNTAIGEICDDSHPCPGGARCATIENLDSEGVCAPSCTSNSDCDTIEPGVAYCTMMPALGAAVSECVLFCAPKTNKCPANWTCVTVQAAGSTSDYSICRPPQTPLPGGDMGMSVDLSASVDMSMSIVDMKAGG